MGLITWAETSVTVNVGDTVTVNFNYGRELDYLQTVSTTDTGIATVATSGDPGAFAGTATITGVAAGTVTTTCGAMDTQATPLTITVTAPTPADDQNFLNERGLAHFWDNISSAISGKIYDAVGWRYLGCVHTETATNQLDFTLPAQYDNYKIIASSVITTNATNGAWQTLSPLNGSALLNFSGFLEKVEGTNWSCEALTSKDYVSQNTTYPYFSVFHEVLSMRSMSSETRHYMTTSVSGGGSTNGRTTRGNFHGVVSTEPTGFRLRMASNYIRSGSIYVWGMNNPT